MDEPIGAGEPPRPAGSGGRARTWAAAATIAAVLSALLVGVLIGRATSDGSANAGATGTPATPATSATTRPTLPPELVAKLAKLPRRVAGDPMAQGSPTAPVVLIEYADYRCPFCGVWARDTRPALQRYIDDGTLRLEYRDVPLFGEQSERAALAARAAGAQGRFWEYYTAVYAEAPTSGHADLTVAKLVDYARRVGVPDLARFERELTDGTHQPGLQRDVDEANGLGISSTPLFFVNTEPIVGAQPVQAFVEAIERQKATPGRG